MLWFGRRVFGEDGGGVAAARGVSREPTVGYAQMLECVRDALRRSALEAAEGGLMLAAPIGAEDAEYQNLLGVLHECRGRVRQARRCYGRALAASRGRYAPAEMNLRRLYELDTFGRTEKVAAIGG